jgi:EAL domain-containing protein (putative c-di-GMP-specific phosphodiesterase class I)
VIATISTKHREVGVDVSYQIFTDSIQAALDAVASGERLPMRTGPAHAPERLTMRLAARNAVFRYQPQIDLQNGRIAGVESVLCIPGMLGHRPATELIAEIDAAGLGLALTEFQIREACHIQRGWLQSFAHDFPIGVPVPQRVLGNNLLLPLAQHILAESGLAPSYLELEIEEAALGVSVNAQRAFSSVRDIGMKIAIDEFNAAHANLRLLAMLPISKLRVAALPLLRRGDGISEQLVFDGILGAARGLGILVCATGVSSPEILAAVLRQGRPLAQGSEMGSTLDSAGFLQCLVDRDETTLTLPQLLPDNVGFAHAAEYGGDTALRAR